MRKSQQKIRFKALDTLNHAMTCMTNRITAAQLNRVTILNLSPQLAAILKWRMFLTKSILKWSSRLDTGSGTGTRRNNSSISTIMTIHCQNSIVILVQLQCKMLSLERVTVAQSQLLPVSIHWVSYDILDGLDEWTVVPVRMMGQNISSTGFQLQIPDPARQWYSARAQGWG